MNNLKIHINLSAGKNGITFQRKENNKYVSVKYVNLDDQEKARISSIFQTLAITYSTGPMTQIEKKCEKCGRLLPLTEFYRKLDSKGHNRGTSKCKECIIKEVLERKRNKHVSS